MDLSAEAPAAFGKIGQGIDLDASTSSGSCRVVDIELPNRLHPCMAKGNQLQGRPLFTSGSGALTSRDLRKSFGAKSRDDGATSPNATCDATATAVNGYAPLDVTPI